MAETMNAATISQTVLVIGAYGLIGGGVVERLLQDGHNVIGLGRDRSSAEKVFPNLPWAIKDLEALCDAEDWVPILSGITMVVNCSGALQDGPADHLETLHVTVVSALAAACAVANIGLIQMSAVGANPQASTAFLRTKAKGDEAIKVSGARYQIFRPGLVLARQSFGGSTMLRMLAAVPIVQPIALAQAQVQTVSLADVATAVSVAVAGKMPSGLEADLVETTPQDLRDVIVAIRHWMGFRPARWTLNLPDFTTAVIGRMANAVSRLGWRSPLRTTAIKVLEDGITATPTNLVEFGVPQPSSLSQTLSNIPIGAQDRLFARMSLLMPVVIVTLVLFWFSAGVIGLLRVNAAALTLEIVGWPHALAAFSVVIWAIVDIAIAAAFAVRKYAALACWAAVIVSGFYLFASTVFVPHLWADPLGPLTKVIPGMVLALVARVGLEAR